MRGNNTIEIRLVSCGKVLKAFDSDELYVTLFVTVTEIILEGEHATVDELGRFWQLESVGHVHEQRDEHREPEEESSERCALDPAASLVAWILYFSFASVLAAATTAADPENEHWDTEESENEGEES